MLQLYRSSIYSSTVTLKILLKSNTELATQTKALEEVEVYDHNLNKSLLFECWATEGTIVLVLNRLCLLWAQMWNTRLKLFPKYFSKKKKKINIFSIVSDTVGLQKSNRSHPKHTCDFRSSQAHTTLHHLPHCSDTPNPNWINRFNSSCKLNEFGIEKPEWKEMYSSGMDISQ